MDDEDNKKFAPPVIDLQAFQTVNENWVSMIKQEREDIKKYVRENYPGFAGEEEPVLGGILQSVDYINNEYPDDRSLPPILTEEARQDNLRREIASNRYNYCVAGSNDGKYPNAQNFTATKGGARLQAGDSFLALIKRTSETTHTTVSTQNTNLTQNIHFNEDGCDPNYDPRNIDKFITQVSKRSNLYIEQIEEEEELQDYCVIS